VRLSPVERAAIERFRDALAARFGGRLGRVVLFGSRARGEGHEESDLDLLVELVDLAPAERREVLDLALEAELATGLRLSPLVRSAGSPGLSPALREAIARDGVAL
jgi:predicted nucleotidyltransferase